MEWIEELFDAIRFGCKQYKFMYRKGSKNLLEYKSMYEILSMIYWYLEQGNIWTMNNPTKITSILVLRRGFDKFFPIVDKVLPNILTLWPTYNFYRLPLGTFALLYCTMKAFIVYWKYLDALQDDLRFSK